MKRGLVLLTCVALAACQRSGSTVHVTGAFFDYKGSFCSQPPNELDGVMVTFGDSQGNVIGSATLGSGSQVSIGSACGISAPFSVDLPKEDLYFAQAGGLSTTLSKSFSDLEAGGFVWNMCANCPDGVTLPA